MGKGYALIKIKRKQGTIYHYRLTDGTTKHTTGQRTKAAADEWVRENVLGRTDGTMTFGQYLGPFFTSACPRIRRIRAEHNPTSPKHSGSEPPPALR